ncbi:EF-hand calcium-binding domain-containing protein 1-like [Teleopsis dalmanni]|uniref:EF-hand calcium-binding domain-containing protein 1-like n=1 Tax=Teleopsis dalmanni TaxID=139649 RepID=UPI0018CDF278|nr:EF-hand calcium-binding domain-containing protein 1-like [Teleopsis dalmanni]XP_037950109.1 EF-hand calcium-binding domain-containing protein 1-like [Teleopsis dalmanni]
MNKLDQTLDDVQNTRFDNTYHDFLAYMVKQSVFTSMEVKCILLVYHKYVLANGPKAKNMTRKQFFHLFLVLFHIYDLQIIERILLHLTSEQIKDVDPIAFVKLFSVFMTDKLEHRMRFAFQIYNVQGTGYLNREVVTQAVEKFFIGDDEDEINELRSDMVELLFQKFDVDKDGVISYEDYSSVVSKQPLLVCFLGECLPSAGIQQSIAVCANVISKVSNDLKNPHVNIEETVRKPSTSAGLSGLNNLKTKK